MTSTSEIANLLLQRLFEFCRTHDDDEIIESTILKLLAPDYGAPFARVALRMLLKDGLLRQTRTAPSWYELTEKFIEEYDTRFVPRRDVVDTQSSEGPQIPASDRVVTLNHNSDPYREALESLDAAIKAFKEDHHLDNQFGPEKKVLLQTLEAGRDLLSDTRVRIATAVTTIVSPLRIIVDTYKDAIVAGLVTASVDAALPLLEKALVAALSLFGLT